MARTTETEKSTGPTEGTPLAPEQNEPVITPTEPIEVEAAPTPDKPILGGKKIKVSTTGDFMFFDPFTLESIDPGKSDKITYTVAVQNALDDGRLKKA